MCARTRSTNVERRGANRGSYALVEVVQFINNDTDSRLAKSSRKDSLKGVWLLSRQYI